MNRKSGANYYRYQMARQILFRYLLTLVGLAVGLLSFVSAAWTLCSRVVWYPDDPVYQALHFIKEYILLFMGLIFLAGWLAATVHYIAKPLGYLEELLAASRQLARPGSEPIELSPALKNAEAELNLVREEALRNALLAKEAEQRKNDLIVYLAHDLKTPLTSVIGYLTLLRDEPQISQNMRERYTGIAFEKAQRLEDLINEFFEITRFSLTTLELETVRIDLSRMMEQLTSEFEPILAEKGLSFQTDFDPGVEILCDPGKLERVFDNLIRNAVNYSDLGSMIVMSMTQGKESVEIRVKNRGRTIPPEKLSRIFEQFFRLDASRATTTGGAGLGLAIAKEIVELHGGDISAESMDGQIMFTITLPCNK